MLWPCNIRQKAGECSEPGRIEEQRRSHSYLLFLRMTMVRILRNTIPVSKFCPLSLLTVICHWPRHLVLSRQDLPSFIFLTLTPLQPPIFFKGFFPKSGSLPVFTDTGKTVASPHRRWEKEGRKRKKKKSNAVFFFSTHPLRWHFHCK